jgi:hypothetical protein
MMKVKAEAEGTDEQGTRNKEQGTGKWHEGLETRNAKRETRNETPNSKPNPKPKPQTPSFSPNL